jgi:DNA-binding CsgD family transcriptional regulator
MNQDAQDNKQPSAEGAALGRAVRVVRLLDLYGPLLTERQRHFLRLHYEGDLSFGEIASEEGISRQAVHDAVKNGEASLEDYEAKLQPGGRRLPKRASAGRGEAEPVAKPDACGSAPVEGLGPVVALLESIHDRLKRSGGVIYNADGVTRDMGDALDLLRQLREGDR